MPRRRRCSSYILAGISLGTIAASLASITGFVLGSEVLSAHDNINTPLRHAESSGDVDRNNSRSDRGDGDADKAALWLTDRVRSASGVDGVRCVAVYPPSDENEVGVGKGGSRGHLNFGGFYNYSFLSQNSGNTGGSHSTGLQWDGRGKNKEESGPDSLSQQEKDSRGRRRRGHVTPQFCCFSPRREQISKVKSADPPPQSSSSPSSARKPTLPSSYSTRDGSTVRQGVLARALSALQAEQPSRAARTASLFAATTAGATASVRDNANQGKQGKRGKGRARSGGGGGGGGGEDGENEDDENEDREHGGGGLNSGGGGGGTLDSDGGDGRNSGGGSSGSGGGGVVRGADGSEWKVGPEALWSWTCLPSFVVAGTQKSGSTALSAFLLNHPQVSMGRGKEIHFFDKDVNLGLLPYLINFATVDGTGAVGSLDTQALNQFRENYPPGGGGGGGPTTEVPVAADAATAPPPTDATATTSGSEISVNPLLREADPLPAMPQAGAAVPAAGARRAATLDDEVDNEVAAASASSSATAAAASSLPRESLSQRWAADRLSDLAPLPTRQDPPPRPPPPQPLTPLPSSSSSSSSGQSTLLHAPPFVNGEATPFYLADEHACEKMADEMGPTAMPQLIVLLRDPVARAYSEYQMKVRRVESQDAFLSSLREHAWEVLSCFAVATSSTPKRLAALTHQLQVEKRHSTSTSTSKMPAALRSLGPFELSPPPRQLGQQRGSPSRTRTSSSSSPNRGLQKRAGSAPARARGEGASRRTLSSWPPPPPPPSSHLTQTQTKSLNSSSTSSSSSSSSFWKQPSSSLASSSSAASPASSAAASVFVDACVPADLGTHPKWPDLRKALVGVMRNSSGSHKNDAGEGGGSGSGSGSGGKNDAETRRGRRRQNDGGVKRGLMRVGDEDRVVGGESKHGEVDGEEVGYYEDQEYEEDEAQEEEGAAAAADGGDASDTPSHARLDSSGRSNAAVTQLHRALLASPALASPPPSSSSSTSLLSSARKSKPPPPPVVMEMVMDGEDDGEVNSFTVKQKQQKQQQQQRSEGSEQQQRRGASSTMEGKASGGSRGAGGPTSDGSSSSSSSRQKSSSRRDQGSGGGGGALDPIDALAQCFYTKTPTHATTQERAQKKKLGEGKEWHLLNELPSASSSSFLEDKVEEEIDVEVEAASSLPPPNLPKKNASGRKLSFWWWPFSSSAGGKKGTSASQPPPLQSSSTTSTIPAPTSTSKSSSSSPSSQASPSSLPRGSFSPPTPVQQQQQQQRQYLTGDEVRSFLAKRLASSLLPDIYFDEKRCAGGKGSSSSLLRERLPPLSSLLEEATSFNKCAAQQVGPLDTAAAAAEAVKRCVKVRHGISSQYLYRGLYAAQLSRCFQSVPKEKVLVLDSDLLKLNPREALSRVHRHLGLHEFDYPDILGSDKGKVPQSPPSTSTSTSVEVQTKLQHVFDEFYPTFESRTGWRMEGDYQPMPEDLRRKLKQFFAPHDALLLDLLAADQLPSASSSTTSDPQFSWMKK